MKCGLIFYIGMGIERICNKPAVAILDAETPNETPVCQECKVACHPTRLTAIAAARGK